VHGSDAKGVDLLLVGYALPLVARQVGASTFAGILYSGMPVSMVRASIALIRHSMVRGNESERKRNSSGASRLSLPAHHSPAFRISTTPAKLCKFFRIRAKGRHYGRTHFQMTSANASTVHRVNHPTACPATCGHCRSRVARTEPRPWPPASRWPSISALRSCQPGPGSNALRLVL